MPERLQQRLVARLLTLDGVVESPSMFGNADAYWCNGKEIAHLVAVDVVDLRLTRPVLRELRSALRDDARVRLRKGGSDWVELQFSSPGDVDFVLELAERGPRHIAARDGGVGKPPPLGSDLERRRRFH